MTFVEKKIWVMHTGIVVLIARKSQELSFFWGFTVVHSHNSQKQQALYLHKRTRSENFYFVEDRFLCGDFLDVFSVNFLHNFDG